jgi:signal transduction histidine kinase
MNILVADDSKPIRTMLRALLEAEGHHVVEAPNGTDALAMMLAPNAPGMAIIDWHMPGMEGVDVCRELRTQPTTQPPYLMLLTVHSGRNEIIRGLKSGADDYVTKPFDEEALLARVQIGERMVGLQRSLAGRVRDLEQSNQELEAFSRMVAHDLKTPLGAIESLTEIALLDLKAGCPQEVLPHLAEISQASAHARNIIDDLLKLSRAALSPLRQDEVDLTDLVTQIATDLQWNSDRRRVDWCLSPGLRVKGDAGLLRLALENLLRNAWKFSSRCHPARIEFGCSGTADATRYFVRDNGAGFAMDKAARLFGAFQRFHSPAEFSGTGIGLTIVKRIVERHGGRIWAESAVNQGATFFFTLPHGGVRGESASSLPTQPASDSTF